MIVIGDATLYQGDCLDALKTLPDCSVDAAYVAIATTRLANGQRQGALFGRGPQDADSERRLLAYQAIVARLSQLELPLAASLDAPAEGAKP